MIGHSELLPAGTTTDVLVALDQPLEGTGLVFPVAHIDANGNGAFEFFPPDETTDGPALTIDGGVAVDGAEVTVEVREAAATTMVVIDARPWGASLHLELTDLPPRDRYIAWVVDEAGERQQAASWGPTPTGAARVDGAAAIPAERVASVLITDGEGLETLVAATAG